MRHTGLSARQIRHYETLGLIRPTRTRGNQRLYSEKDLGRLSLIKELLGRGLSLEGVSQVLSLEEKAGVQPPAAGLGQEEVPARFYPSDHIRVPVTGRLSSLYPVSHPRDLLELLQAIKEKNGK